ncbi:integral membrane protein [Aspergillus sclerotialis]|uniref:Integral membrane protein n=1 Tax=Aspergillus sclerotialis TaxID=2070753 RepID=A0A3A2ZMH4_9EURO|nr:integral membrane protein [Aspergillus sclerotialis]
MASGLFTDYRKPLLLTPLLTSTGTLMYAGCEALFYSAFTHSPIRAESNALLPRWFQRVFDRNIYLLVGLNMVTISTATAVLTLPNVSEVIVSKGSRKLFLSGLIGTCAHFVFAPTMLGIIENITSDRFGNCTEHMKHWLRVHYIRFIVADVPAWLAYIGGVLTTFAL